MNNRAAGQRFEAKCKKYLESIGFTVDKARAALHFIGPGKFFSSQCDFFGAADLMAIHPAKTYTLFVQCHRGTSLNPRREKLEKVPWNFKAQKVQLWTADEIVRGGIRTWIRESWALGWEEARWKMESGVEAPFL